MPDRQGSPPPARNLAERLLFEPPPPQQERRGATHYAICRTVKIWRSHKLPSTATTINLSQTGAALRLFRNGAGTWPGDLEPSDEVRLGGLVQAPIDCWVVERSNNLLRLRFEPDPLVDAQLSALIEKVAAAGPAAAGPAPGMTARRIRKPAIAAGVVLLLIPLFLLGAGCLDLMAPLAPQAWRPPPRQVGQVGVLPPVRSIEGPVVEDRHRAEADGPPGAAPPIPANAAEDFPASRQPQRFVLGAGTEFTVVMTGRLGAPGEAAAEIDDDVPDTMQRAHVLLPRGTRLLGMWLRNGGAKGQATGVIWTEGGLPDGTIVRLGAGRTAGGTAPDIRDAYLVTLRGRSAAPDLGLYDFAAGSRITVTVHRDLVLPAYGAQAAQPAQGGAR